VQQVLGALSEIELLYTVRLGLARENIILVNLSHFVSYNMHHNHQKTPTTVNMLAYSTTPSGQYEVAELLARLNSWQVSVPPKTCVQ
jgi:hypothetical protein